jgi:glucokinase
MTVLACDLGGTNTRLLLTRWDGDSFHQVEERFYPSADYDGLAPILSDFLGGLDHAQRPRSACIALAGPVHADAGGQRARVTNLPWSLDSAALQADTGIDRIRLINDFQAVGYGLATLKTEDLATLQDGQPDPEAPRALIGAGTGLGEGIVLPQEGGFQVLASEGGHVDFAPTDDTQAALLEFVRAECGRASYEHLLSGPGLTRIYHFMCSRPGAQPGESLRRAAESGDPAAAVSAHALDASDPLAVAALDLFLRIYGAQAGNLALTCLARGGVYIAGGIAPRILPRLRQGPFLEAFRAKGKMAELMGQIPVHVVVNDRVGLQGAAWVAARL